MPKSTARSHQLADADLRLLRVFQAVVRHNGFAAAQAELGISGATISNHMAELEQRLGVRLCKRGRRGFSLTEEGARIHEGSLNLFRSVENFSSVVGSVRGDLSGSVHFATVDAMQTNAELGLELALGEFSRRARGVVVHIDIASPHDLRQRLLDGRYQLVLTPLEEAHPSITSTPIFDEVQALYCGKGHPLFAMPERELASALAKPHRYAARKYETGRSVSHARDFEVTAMTSHMESLALLILSGGYLGHLPEHYARQWVVAGQMRSLRPKSHAYVDTFHLAQLSREQNRAVALLSECIVQSAGRGS
ncbi:MAG: LysR family transcriptional regulator [Hyphomicrobiaceae bacterium]